MQPNQNQYDFILQDKPKQKLSWLPSPGGKTGRILMTVGVAVVVLMIILVLFSVFTSGDKAASERLLSAAQQHAEIIRVAGMGTEKARDQQAKNLATTAKISLLSSQGTLQTTISKQAKVDAKKVALGKDAKTDELFTEAEQSNRFDEIFIEKLTALMVKYRADIKSIHDDTGSETNKKVYADIYKQLTALIPKEN